MLFWRYHGDRENSKIQMPVKNTTFTVFFFYFVFKDSEVVEVALQSQDIIGLGFNITGSMRDGIFVSQVHHRGPASETGKIEAGEIFFHGVILLLWRKLCFSFKNCLC